VFLDDLGAVGWVQFHGSCVAADAFTHSDYGAGPREQVEHVVSLLRGQTKMLEETDSKTGKLTGKYKPVVEMQALNTATGEIETKAYTPEDAVKKMKDTPDTWGNLFKSGVVSGIGAGTATGGLMPGQSGRLSAEAINKLTHEQYLEIRANHPEWLGLNPLPGKKGR